MKTRIKRVFAAIKTAWNPPPAPKPKSEYEADPLDITRPRKRAGSLSDPGFNGMQLPSVDQFPVYIPTRTGIAAMDGALADSAMDDEGDGTQVKRPSSMNTGGVPVMLQDWYIRQSFIGYQSCAIIAQHWLVDKACSMPGEDAVRNGWELNVTGDKKLSEEALNSIKELDKKLNIKNELAQFVRFTNIFGIRVLLFKVESDDPLYYEKPFNPDGVAKGSYKGIRQIDPYWMMPVLTSAGSGDPTSDHFYDPEYWQISGKKYHRSHLVIGRGPQPADILKPMYIFGGIPLTQRIYERVYAAERTANEAPMLAMNKRTSVVHVDVKKAALNQDAFENRMAEWIAYRDNQAVKIMGLNETMEQFDTSLSDFDSVIMNQYQLVAAICKVPATKMLGTSPKGFNATGEFEENSYSQELESIQENWCTPVLDRHNLLTIRSMGLDVQVTVSWEPTDAQSKKALAELNKVKSETGKALIEVGALSPDEERTRVRNDKHSGYNNLSDDTAETDFGMSPENIEKVDKGASELDKGNAAMNGTAPAPREQGAAEPGKQDESMIQNEPEPVPAATVEKASGNNTNQDVGALKSLQAKLQDLLYAVNPNGKIFGGDTVMNKFNRVPAIKPAVLPSVHSIGRTVGEMDEADLPKMNFQGMKVVIENPKGSVRSGQDEEGKTWNSQMHNHYGYVKDSIGADGDGVDVFIGPNIDSPNAFVVNQNNKDGAFDEHKVMLGFDDEEQARQAYMSAFSKDWHGFGSMKQIPVADLKDWLASGNCTMPM